MTVTQLMQGTELEVEWFEQNAPDWCWVEREVSTGKFYLLYLKDYPHKGFVYFISDKVGKFVGGIKAEEIPEKIKWFFVKFGVLMTEPKAKPLPAIKNRRPGYYGHNV